MSGTTSIYVDIPQSDITISAATRQRVQIMGYRRKSEMRSIKKTMQDTEAIVSELKITRDELTMIMVDAYGRGSVQLSPSGFVRVFRSLMVRRDTMRADVHDGNLHAEFTIRQTRFSTIVMGGTREFDALTGGEHVRLKSSQPLIATTR